MINDLIPTPKMSVDSYTDPAESFQAEAAWKANASWAKESNDYVLLLNYFKLWILQRRRTTELVQAVLPGPGAFYGNQFLEGNNGVTKLVDFGFTKMQWHRRVKELEVPGSVFESYLDECIEMTRQPTLYGLLRFSGSSPVVIPKGKVECPRCLGKGWIQEEATDES